MIEATDMEGVFLTPLRTIIDDRGSIMKMMGDVTESWGAAPDIVDIAEIYFSTINPGIVKAWHGHKKMTLNYACIQGFVIVGLCDLRVGKTFGKTAMVKLDDRDNYKLLTIPPGVWNGYRSNNAPAIIANAATMVYSDLDIERIHPKDFPIPFDWGEYEIAG